MGGVTIIGSHDAFKKAIASDTPSVFDFHAVWCGPCKTISPVFEKLSNSTEGVNFYSVDVDDQSDVAQECGITAMPTFIAFKSGEQQGNVRGAIPAQLQKLISDAAALK